MLFASPSTCSFLFVSKSAILFQGSGTLPNPCVFMSALGSEGAWSIFPVVIPAKAWNPVVKLHHTDRLHLDPGFRRGDEYEPG